MIEDKPGCIMECPLKDEMTGLSREIKENTQVMLNIATLGKEFVTAVNSRIPVKMVYLIITIIFIGHSLTEEKSILSIVIKNALAMIQ